MPKDIKTETEPTEKQSQKSQPKTPKASPPKSPEKQTGRGLEGKEGERAESEAEQGFTGKMPIVENFFGLQGQEREFDSNLKQKRSPRDKSLLLFC